MTPGERDTQRRAIFEEDAKRKERQARGIVEPVLNEKEALAIERITRISAMAKIASRTKIAVRVFDDKGAPMTLEERVGQEDYIFQYLLMATQGNQGSWGGQAGNHEYQEGS